MESILPTVQALLKYKFMFIAGVETRKKSRKGEGQDFIDDYIETAWAEEEVQKWMTKQAVRYLKRGDYDRAMSYEHRTWESFIGRFYDKQIDRASEELSKSRGPCGEH